MIWGRLTTRWSHGLAARPPHAGADGGAPAGSGPVVACGRVRAGRDCPADGRQPCSGDAVEAALGPRWAERAPAAPVVGAYRAAERSAVGPALDPAPAGGRGGRVRDRAVDAPVDRPRHRAPVRGPVPLPLARPRLARPGLEPPAAAGPGAGRGADRRLVAPGWAADNKGARRTGRAVAFLDEVGHTFRAPVGTTWAPTGQPPVLRRLSGRREVSSLGVLVTPLGGPARLY